MPVVNISGRHTVEVELTLEEKMLKLTFTLRVKLFTFPLQRSVENQQDVRQKKCFLSAYRMRLQKRHIYTGNHERTWSRNF